MSIPTNFPLACREADHALAVKAGLRADTPIAQLSVHQFAEAIRAEEAAKVEVLMRIAQLVVQAVESRQIKDWQLMHMEISEAGELAAPFFPNGGAA